jgi:hypothetical protein
LRRGTAAVERFDGFSFRFASPDEVEHRTKEFGFDAEAAALAAALPRYLAAVPVSRQPDISLDYAKQGFATVVALTLETADAVHLSISQVQELLT